MSVLEELCDAGWVVRDGWILTPAQAVWNYLNDVGEAKPVEILFYFDTRLWTGERCIECGATTHIDKQYSVGSGSNFCGACGNQLKPQDVLEIRKRTPENLRQLKSTE